SPGSRPCDGPLPVACSGVPESEGTACVCGIIALQRGPGSRRSIPPAEILDRLDALPELMAPGADPVASADAASALLEELDALLRSTDGVAVLVREPHLATRISASCAAVTSWVRATEE